MNEAPDLSHASWFKSSYSNGQGGECVEVATSLPGMVAVRDSKHPDAPALILSRSAWQGLVTSLR